MGVLVLWYFSAWDMLWTEDEAESLNIDEGRHRLFGVPLIGC